MEKKQFKKTFTRSEVEDYVKKMLATSEVTMCEQKDRILELKREIDELKRDKADRLEKQKMLSKAMNEATKTLREEQKAHEIQLKIVLEKIKQFGFKWGNYFTDVFNKTKELKDNNTPTIFESELVELLEQLQESSTMLKSNSEQRIPNSKAELKVDESEWLKKNVKKLNEAPEYSISEESEKKYKKVMSKLKNQMVFTSELSEPSESGFSIDEALHPEDSLDDIIGDIKEQGKDKKSKDGTKNGK